MSGAEQDAVSRPTAARPGVDESESAFRSPHRLYGLTDGVFAIAMTLLAIDVRIPAGLSDAGAVAAMRDFYGAFGVFLLVFLVTGRFWLASHVILAGLTGVDRTTLNRAIIYLAGICSLPVASTLLFRYGSVPQAVTFASIVLAFTSLSGARLWWYVSDPAHHLQEQPVDTRTRATTLFSSVFNAVVLLLAIPLAYLLDASGLSSGWAPLVWWLLPLDGVLLSLLRRLGWR